MVLIVLTNNAKGLILVTCPNIRRIFRFCKNKIKSGVLLYLEE